MAGGGFEKKTEYSFGYIARVNGTDFFKEDKSSRRVKRDLESKRQEEAEGQLFLVEKVGDKTIIGDLTNNKEQKSLTPKKFLLIGSNRDSREIEVTGLVSLVQFGHNGINAKCSKKEEAGAILDGSCDKVFFKSYNGENPPTFIKKELVKEDKSSVAIMQLTPKGKRLGVVWGQKKEATGDNENKWSRTGYLYLSGKEETGEVVRKAWTDIDKSQKVKGFFVVHDLIFSENGISKEWAKEQKRWGTILVKGVKKREELTKNTQKDIRALKGTSVGDKVIDIPLSSNRNYYIWDPSKTQIKNGEFVTTEGIKLPFKLKFDTNWNSLLIK